jgi:hypothetical protein
VNIAVGESDIRFTPNNGHSRLRLSCPLSAEKQSYALQPDRHKKKDRREAASPNSAVVYGSGSGFHYTLSFVRSSLRKLAERRGGTRLEGLYGRQRDLLSQRCEFPGLLGQRFELYA